jgi:hypothetical protein
MQWIFAARTLPDGFAVALALRQPAESPAQVAAILAARAA